MTRQYATIDCEIWDDEDFCRLSAGAQRTYFMLISQKDIAACGTLPLTLRRWARTCNEKDVEAWLAELSDEAYVLIDEDTEEVLVRTFARYDGGYKHSKRVQAVVSSARAIRSATLRDIAATELATLGVSIAKPVPLVSVQSGNTEAIQNGRVLVTEVSTDRTPKSGNLGGEPSPSGEDVEPSQFCPQHPDGTTANCGRCAGARKVHDRWAARATKREAAKKAAARALIDACSGCDEHGRVLSLDDGKILGFCDHPDVRGHCGRETA